MQGKFRETRISEHMKCAKCFTAIVVIAYDSGVFSGRQQLVYDFFWCPSCRMDLNINNESWRKRNT